MIDVPHTRRRAPAPMRRPRLDATPRPQAPMTHARRSEQPGRSGASVCIGGFKPSSAARAGFTLIELLIVLAIIVLVISMAAPAMQGMFASNARTQAVALVNHLLVRAQAHAQAIATPVGIRIERAYKVDGDGLMLDADGNNTVSSAFNPSRAPVWLKHQQARIVEFASFKDVLFRAPEGSKPVNLPENAWVAPGYALGFAAATMVDDVGRLIYDPTDIDNRALPYNRLDTFFVVFNAQGELTRFEPAKNTYRDETQRYYRNRLMLAPNVDDPDFSALSMVVYDREKYDGIPPTDGARRLDLLQREGLPVHVSRISGATIVKQEAEE